MMSVVRKRTHVRGTPETVCLCFTSTADTPELENSTQLGVFFNRCVCVASVILSTQTINMLTGEWVAATSL